MNEINFEGSLKFLLIRSGSTELDQQGRILGALDLPLSTQGESEILQTAEELSRIIIDRMYAAPCQSAQQSANLLGKKLKIKVRTESKLANLDCGLWHGKSIEELRETQPTLFKQWRDHPESINIPQGEPIGELQDRVTNFVQKMFRKFKTGTIAIVAPEPILGFVRREIEPAAGSERPFRPIQNQWELISPQAMLDQS